jgi:hypothetical protein
MDNQSVTYMKSGNCPVCGMPIFTAYGPGGASPDNTMATCLCPSIIEARRHIEMSSLDRDLKRLAAKEQAKEENDA